MRPNLKYFLTVSSLAWARRGQQRTMTIAEWIAAIETADFERDFGFRCDAVHFPVGRFPQLYQESETVRQGKIGWDLARECQEVVRGGWQRSQYGIELKRAVWIQQGRRKESYAR